MKETPGSDSKDKKKLSDQIEGGMGGRQDDDLKIIF